MIPCRKVEEVKIEALHSLSCVKSLDVEELVPLQNKWPCGNMGPRQLGSIGILYGGLQRRHYFARVIPCRKVDKVRRIGTLHILPCVESLEIEEVVLLQNVIIYVGSSDL